VPGPKGRALFFGSAKTPPAAKISRLRASRRFAAPGPIESENKLIAEAALADNHKRNGLAETTIAH
jgi:hypothetical protein